MDRKEAIEVVRKKVDYYEADKRLKAAMEALIPELVEGEDEMTRKNILALVKKHAVNHERCQMEAYLEKQKEQKAVQDSVAVVASNRPTISKFEAGKAAVLNNPEQYGLRTINKFAGSKRGLPPGTRTMFPIKGDDDEKLLGFMRDHFWNLVKLQDENERMYTRCLVYLDKLNEQKPADRVFTFDDVLALESAMALAKDDKELHGALKSIFERVHDAYHGEQQPAEWTDADEKILERIINRLKFVIPVPAKDPIGVTFEHREDSEAINWLKRRVTSLPQLEQEWGEEDDKNWKAVLGYVNDDALRVWLEKRIKSLRPHHTIRWHRATEGANIPESIIIPDGEEPRFGKCAVKNSYYIPIEELKNLPKES